MIAPPSGTQGLVIIFAALLGAIIWNLVTWYFGLPSSSTHALIGGLVGAALAGRHDGALVGGRRQGRDPDAGLAAGRLRARPSW